MSRASPRRRRPDIAIPFDCRDMIEDGALVAISSSGGKDSQAMTILLSRVVPREQLLIIHAPLGELEWPDTVRHIESTIPSGVPLILARTASGNSLLDKIEERGRFPKNVTNAGAVIARLDKAKAKYDDIILVHGGGPGVERIAAQWAERNGVHQVVCKPVWNAHGRAAPFRRNDELLNLLPKGVIAFPGSGITDNLADKAVKLGIPVQRVTA